MKSRIFFMAFTLAALFLMQACRSAKTVSPGKEIPSPERITENDLRRYFGDIAAGYDGWTDLSMPIKVELQAPKRFSVSGKASMVRGKSIDISLRFLGMEVASIKADRDSVYVLYKLEKVAVAESVSRLSATYGFDLEDLQCMLIGRLFVPGKGQAQASSASDFICGLIGAGRQWYAEPRHAAEHAPWRYVLALPDSVSEAPRLEGIEAGTYASAIFSASYGPFTATETGPMAESVTVSGTIRARKVAMSIRWNTGRASWNKGISPATGGIPDGYTRISLEKLNRALNSL